MNFHHPVTFGATPPQGGDGVEPVGNTPQEFAAFIRGEMRKWAQAVRDSGAKVE
jgi:hypothetical protein